MSSKELNPFKDFQSDQIQRRSRKIFTAHYACRNAALNLTPVTGTTNGFIFQIINSLIESWRVRLTWFDCNGFLPYKGHLEFSGVFFLAKTFEKVSFDPYNIRITRISARKSEQMKNFGGIKTCLCLPFKN